MDKVIKLLFNVRGEDKYLVQGVRTLLIEACRGLVIDNSGEVPTIPDVWVLSSIRIDELLSFIYRREYPQPCLVFGDGRLEKLLLNKSNAGAFIFFDLRMPLLQLRWRLRRTILSLIKGKRITSRLVRRSRQRSLTDAESEFLYLFMRGDSLKEISQKIGKSAKYVSFYKRKIMVKVDALTNQELFIRACAMGFYSGQPR